MPEKALLPLFPLEVVLLPNALLPLHIFEPRYRKMVGDAIESETEFGVLRRNEGSIEAVGCAARVDRVIERYDDGRFDIETRGTRRFRANSLDHSEEVLRGVVEFFDDSSPAQADLSKVEALLDAAKEVGKLTRSRSSETFEPNHPLLSFQVAAGLPVELKIKQELLESTSEIERVEMLTGYLRGVLDRFGERKKLQRIAGTNGHSKLG